MLAVPPGACVSPGVPILLAPGGCSESASKPGGAVGEQRRAGHLRELRHLALVSRDGVTSGKGEAGERVSRDLAMPAS